MCGHVGIAGKLEFRDEATFKRLLLLDFFRGPDSTGVAVLKNDGNCKVVKMASHPLDLFDAKKYGEAITGYNSAVFMGHNRLATKGKVNAVNAHPFVYDHIVGCHNGTLTTESWRALEKLSGETTDVDSQAIFAAIAAVGIEETVKHLDGAWALVWIDTEEGTLNFLRNKEREFWMAYAKDFDKIFWASEWPMIRAATDLAVTDYELAKTDKAVYYATMVDWWYRIDLKKLQAGSEVRPKPRVKQLKGKEPAPVVTHTSVAPFLTQEQIKVQNGSTSQDRHGQGTQGTHGTGVTNTQKTTPITQGGGTKTSGTPASLDFPFVKAVTGSPEDPFGGAIDEERFKELARYGCSWCSADIHWGETGVSVYDTDDAILCPECTTHNHDQNRVYMPEVSKVA